jgi:putative pyruvate formate lyase activating enzyme
MSSEAVCRLCGRECRAQRSGPGASLGFCGAGEELVGVSQALIHRGEEPPISGSPPGGSGTIFFSRCNLECVFCQNWEISQTPGAGEDITPGALADIMFQLKAAGAYNINLVSPTPYCLQIAKAVASAKGRGLGLPVIYNTGGYDSPEAIEMLDGLIDVYLPDLKMGPQGGRWPDEWDSLSRDLLGVPDYPEKSLKAVKKMFAQVGHLRLDETGMAARGLAVRHLDLPDNLARTDRVLRWISDNLGPEIWLSLMAQYYPANKVRAGYNPELARYPGLGRPLSLREYEKWVGLAWSLGLANTFVQDLESSANYLPDFSKPEVFS